MKTVLIATHQISFASPQSLYRCVGVLALAAVLKKRNLQCEIPDLIEYHNLNNSDCDEVLNSIVEKIILFKPDILGFSTMSNNLPIALELAKRVKQVQSEVHIILGGPGTAFCAKEVLMNFPQVDVIFRGEADNNFPDYVSSLIESKANNELGGLVYRSVDKIIDNGWPEAVKNLDDLPVPDYLFSSESYIKQTATLFGNHSAVSIEIGRGCPYSCSFCSTSVYFRRKYRLKSTDRVIEEILLIQKRIGSARIIFNHDVFTLKRSYVLELCDKIKKNFPNLDWMCLVRLNTLDEELLTKMYDSGCREIFIGLESATEKMQNAINKKLDINKFNLLTDIATRINMKIIISFIVGFPEEDENDIREMFSYVIKAKYNCRGNVVLHLNTLVPMMGTPLYEKWKSKLVYDDYGSSSTTDIPFIWTGLRKIIKTHPEIFSVYFHLDIGETNRINSSKYENLGTMLEEINVNAILLAYEWLGENIADIFVKHIDQIILPEPSTVGNAGSTVVAESVRQLIYRALEHEPVAQKMYDAVAKYEIANYDVRHTKINGHFKIIEVFFNPVKLTGKINNFEAMKQVAKNLNIRNLPHYFMIFWDEKENKLKNTEISSDLAKLIGNGKLTGKEILPASSAS
jgi:radical SAM superfamily enzyme YgiQ (UPF0313 family)